MNTTSPIDLTGNIGAYMRVSDRKQEIETQKQTIRDFEKRHNVAIDSEHLYIDIDCSRDETDTRPEWLRMLANVKARRLNVIVITAKDRFGTASGRDKIVFYDRLWKAGCRLMLATTDEILNAPNIASDFSAYADGLTEEKELREKSNRALDKMHRTMQRRGDG